MVFQGRWNYPHKYFRYFLIIVTMVGLMLYYPKILSVQAAVTLLIVTYYLKLLEMFRIKDVYVILILSYFVIATVFLFEDDLIMLPYFFGALFTTSTALIATNRSAQSLAHGGTFKLGLKLCGQAVPIGLVFFLFFPRFDPFWVLNTSQVGDSVGISDQMTPGDIAQLGAKDGVAFRVEFDQAQPKQKDLYWRALTLSKFDGKTWATTYDSTSADSSDFSLQRLQLGHQLLNQGPKYNYSITLEPSEQYFLPLLDRPARVDQSNTLFPDQTFISPLRITSLTTYRGTSYPQGILDPTLVEWGRKQELSMPVGFNPRTLEFAQDEFARLNLDKQRYISAMLKIFRQQEFIYTLKPGTYGRDTIDEFLFERKRGFCAHYSQAFIMLMRAVGIPARMVVGYHGGEVNPIGGHLVVHQYEAHAWVEVWLKDKGWVRHDPTAMVAPWRIENGIEDSLQEGQTESGDRLNRSVLRSSALANKIRLMLDYSNHRWNKYVVNFDRQQQQQMLSQLINSNNIMHSIMLMLGGVALSLAIIAGFVFLKKNKPVQEPWVELLLTFELLMNKLGLERRKSESVDQFIQRHTTQLNTFGVLSQAEAIVSLLDDLAYKPLSDKDQKSRKNIIRQQLIDLKYYIKNKRLKRLN